MANPFIYVKPDSAQAGRMTDLSETFSKIYEQMLAWAPINRERALAITKLQESRMWINASILEIGKD